MWVSRIMVPNLATSADHRDTGHKPPDIWTAPPPPHTHLKFACEDIWPQYIGMDICPRLMSKVKISSAHNVIIVWRICVHCIYECYFRRSVFSPIGVLYHFSKKLMPLISMFLRWFEKKNELRHDKTNKMSVRPAKTQISLGIRPVWSESSLSAWRNLGSLATQWVHSEDADQTGRMPRLIWVFAGRKLTLLVLWCRGLFLVNVYLVQQYYEPPHDKTNKMACALSEDSDQPGHQPSLIRVLTVCSMDS